MAKLREKRPLRFRVKVLAASSTMRQVRNTDQIINFPILVLEFVK